MIDGLLLLMELGFLVHLLWSVDRAERPPTNNHLGLFSYKENQTVEKKKSPKRSNFRA